MWKFGHFDVFVFSPVSVATCYSFTLCSLVSRDGAGKTSKHVFCSLFDCWSVDWLVV